MSRIANVLSCAAIVLMAFAIGALFIGYTLTIEQPTQGGWNSYRVHECALQIAPYVALLAGLVVTRMRNCPRWLFFLGMTFVLFFGALVCLGLVAMDVQMHNLMAFIIPILLAVVLAGHLAYLARQA
jgi:hypothetical protein